MTGVTAGGAGIAKVGSDGGGQYMDDPEVTSKRIAELLKHIARGPVDMERRKMALAALQDAHKMGQPVCKREADSPRRGPGNRNWTRATRRKTPDSIRYPG